MSREGITRGRSASADEVRVLHVDDDEPFGDITAEMLEREEDEIEVVTETTAEAGIERLADERVDCVVSDYEMPGTNGVEFLDAVRERHPDLPFILFTGKGSEEVASEAFSAGATDYLQKEAGTDQFTVLANAVQNAVETVRTRTRQQRLLHAIGNIQEGVRILDRSGRVIYANEACAKMHGYGTEEIVGNHWTDLHPDDEVPRVREEVVATAQEEGYWHGQLANCRADGSTFTADHVVSQAETGEIVCTVRDVSGKDEWRQELNRYRTLVETLNDAVYVLDDTGAFEYVNDAYVELVGYSREELIGSHVSMVASEEAIEDAGTHLARILSSDGPDTVQFEVSIQPKEGDPIPCEDHLGVLPYEGDSFNGSLGLLRDITARKEREAELERYETVVEALGDPVYALDGDGCFTYLNDAYAEQSGYAKKALLGDHVSRVLPESEPPAAERSGPGLCGDEERDSVVREQEILLADGDRLQVEACVASLPADDDGDHPGVAGVLRDITERKRRERQLKRQNKRLDEFASIVSHDLRNPLNVAQARLTLAQDAHGGEHLEDVADALERMETLIDSLLVYAREGMIVTDVDSTRVAATARRAWDTTATENASLTLDTRLIVGADASSLQRMFENLIHNAVEHGGRDVTVTVGATETGFYIADDGKGIPADERDGIFEAGYSTGDDGTGLGLAIVRTIAEAHGWEVAVTESAGGGARFEVSGVDRIEG